MFVNVRFRIVTCLAPWRVLREGMILGGSTRELQVFEGGLISLDRNARWVGLFYRWDFHGMLNIFVDEMGIFSSSGVSFNHRIMRELQARVLDFVHKNMRRRCFLNPINP